MNATYPSWSARARARIDRDRDVRLEEQPTRRERCEDLLDEPLLVVDVMDDEERNNEVERSACQ
jgi:hypothetical protein